MNWHGIEEMYAEGSLHKTHTEQKKKNIAAGCNIIQGPASY
jgi:hypothetical protein